MFIQEASAEIIYIVEVPANAFDLNIIRQKTSDAFKWLVESALGTANQHREIEIIPYETLWLIALRSVDQPPATGSPSKSITTLPKNLPGLCAPAAGV